MTPAVPVDLLNAVRIVAAGDALIAPRITRRLTRRRWTTAACNALGFSVLAWKQAYG